MPTTINPRVALWALLGIALFLNYQMWSHDYPEVPAAASAGASTAPATPLDSTVPTATAPAGTQQSATAPAASPAAGAPGTASADSAHGLVAHALVADSPTAPSVHVVTDVLDVEVSLAGGELRRVDLLAYPQAKDTAGYAGTLAQPRQRRLTVRAAERTGAGATTNSRRRTRRSTAATRVNCACCRGRTSSSCR